MALDYLLVGCWRMLHEQCSQKWEFLRGFSDLGRLQRESTLRYSCSQDETGIYRFCLTKNCNGTVRQETADVRCAQSAQACRMLQYLYENAIPMENWTDVLEELQKIV